MTDAEAQILIPRNDVAEPEVSIVIPAMNEEPVIGEFIDWCMEGIEKAGARAEILIVDSSADRTPEIALEKGARVLKTPPRGLGRAYRDALGVIRGRYVIMGDADCTYDFREIGPFLERFREGHEYIMGSRFRGSVEAGAMPALHRYFGTPLTNFLLNLIYGTKFSDIHCGMRGITLAALKDMNIRSRSWEYASEMVVKSVRMKLRTVEVPVRFYKDRHGRQSHHKRIGWFSPWHAGWINLRAMLIYGADFFVMKPGMALLAAGLVIALGLMAGPVTLGGITFSLNTMMLGATLSIIGLQCLFLGCMAQTLYDPTGEAKRRWLRVFAYTRTMAFSGLLFAAGAGLGINFVNAYVSAGYTVFADMVTTNHLGLAGLTAIMLSFLTFVSTLLLHAIAAHAPEPPAGAGEKE
ncbi:MAG: glycosyl transferase family 2 [Rhodospirillaceae bacterium]|mgnify:FL=1|jgi:glycosyltransferase involved in cell wall biosynthesis|nr:glycosyl transferase family 2 [Rhodospirillaceae bacterium]|tara:strand:+ start:139 stop:1365 length:1227 start_codon:yes stop_codon:yes gene_type:complete